ncbi:MAG: DUF2325 domain-containing protein [Desulfobacteraceae bacterium]
MVKNMEQAIQSITSSDLCQDLSTEEAKNPLRFWEIQAFFKCPVVGICLTSAEQKQCLKKTRISPKNATPFEIHEAVVASSEGENRVSRRADRLLQRKFGKEAADLLRLDDEAFMAHFKTAHATGDHAAALWATAIHPDLPLTLKREIFGQIHMSMHFSGEERMRMNRKLACQHSRLEKMRRSNKDAAQQKRALEKENHYLRQSRVSLKTALAAAEKEIERMKNESFITDAQLETVGPGLEHSFLKSELEALYACNKKQQCQITALKKKNRQLASQIGCQKELNRRFRQETRTIFAEMAAKNRCDESCPSFDLCQKRILIVGGMSRMESLYRELIEAGGGIFEYHDGYMKKGARRLESCLRRADVVLCPVNCNSHTACAVVKSLAKKHHKTVHMLANFSLKAVSQAIWGTTNGN